MRARRAMSDDSVPRALVLARPPQPAALRRLPRPPRLSVLFAGVAASSAFQDAQRRPARRRPDARRSAATRSPTRSRRADLQAASNGRLEKIDLGATMRSAAAARPSARCTPCAPTSRPPTRRSARCRASSRARRPARSGSAPACAATSGARSRRTSATCRSGSREGDKVFTGAADDLTPNQRDIALAQALDGLTRSYASNPPPATFRLIVSPLVSWIWIGALIVFLGGLIALWPPARRAPRPVAARYAARVAQELGRA